ncbi:hypothetical protein OAA47_00420 [Methylophilaceae bacterium]|nr:hypothetical protein [Methylophilaceae bacterium]
MINLEELANKYFKYIKKRIESVEIITHPFPHVVIDDYLPQEMYEFIMEAYPEKYEMVNPYNKVRTYNNIWQLDIVADPFVKGGEDNSWHYSKHLPHDKKTFKMCNLVERVIFSQELAKLWASFFLVPKNLKLIQVGRLAIDGYGAGLGPHVDRDDKYISNVLYLAKGHEPSFECGTNLLEPKTDKVKKDLEGVTDHQTYDDFNIIKTVEYVPNRLIAWKVVPESWHSYHQTFDGDRRAIKYFIQEDLLDYSKLRAEKELSAATSQDWRNS